MLELHFAVPAAGAILVPINVRITAAEVAYILEHSGARALVVHPTLAETAAEAVARLAEPPLVVETRSGPHDGSDYEARLAAAEPTPIEAPADETAFLSINYT